ncbi:hypothetical protein [Neptuniibacter sp. QD37_11]|uniref:hypothetical protein n=1 Tax=Neptuniibacter sp. QD37_11 TaxID=3398209 RepID=UPI0039F49FAF
MIKYIKKIVEYAVFCMGLMAFLVWPAYVGWSVFNDMQSLAPVMTLITGLVLSLGISFKNRPFMAAYISLMNWVYGGKVDNKCGFELYMLALWTIAYSAGICLMQGLAFCISALVG